MKLPFLFRKFAFAWGIAAGVTISVLAGSIMGNPLTADISEEDLNVRSNGVIKTQQSEIQRLRAELRALESRPASTTSASAVSSVSSFSSTIKTCRTHSDCPAIDMVCQNGACKKLNNASCGCMQSQNGSYVLCVSEDGEGKEARTVSCGTNKCLENPYPRCSNE